jgi:hypothetical protein
VAIDDVLPTASPTMVKLDIEGFEPSALSGATRLLERARPVLAVCVYHAPVHLWSIARQIAQLHLDYRFSLRAHGMSSFDLVLYAIPTGRIPTSD